MVIKIYVSKNFVHNYKTYVLIPDNITIMS